MYSTCICYCTPSRDSPKRGYIHYKCLEGNLPQDPLDLNITLYVMQQWIKLLRCMVLTTSIIHALISGAHNCEIYAPTMVTCEVALILNVHAQGTSYYINCELWANYSRWTFLAVRRSNVIIGNFRYDYIQTSMEHSSALYLEIILVIIWQVVTYKCWLY